MDYKETSTKETRLLMVRLFIVVCLLALILIVNTYVFSFMSIDMAGGLGLIGLGLLSFLGGLKYWEYWHNWEIEWAMESRDFYHKLTFYTTKLHDEIEFQNKRFNKLNAKYIALLEEGNKS